MLLEWWDISITIYYLVHTSSGTPTGIWAKDKRRDINMIKLEMGGDPWQGSKLLGFRMSGTPKNGDRNPDFFSRVSDRKPGNFQIDGQN